MSTVVNDMPRIANIQVTEDAIIAQLVDGRTISVPLAWSWRLSEATPEQRNNLEIIGNGLGVHWPDIDEDISATGMLYGMPARPPHTVHPKRAPRRAHKTTGPTSIRPQPGLGQDAV